MKSKHLLFIFLFTCSIVHSQTTIQITHNNEDQLADALNFANANPNELIIIEIIDTDQFAFVISKELPLVTGNVLLTSNNSVDFSAASTYVGSFLGLGSGGKLQTKNIFKITNFYSNNRGAGFFANGNSILISEEVEFANLESDDDGGAVFCDTGSQCSFSGGSFNNNISGGSGGAISCLGECTFEGTTFDGNSAANFSCQVDVAFGSNVSINQCTMSDTNNSCDTNFFDVPGGNLQVYDCSIITDNDSPFASCTGNCDLRNNTFFDAADGNKASSKTVCNDFGTGAFHSLGYNIDSGAGCFLNHSTDLENTDPMVTIDANGIPQPNVGSPVIESGPVDFVNNVLPCAYKDMNGLGRPQDFDGDGVFTCDRGPVEVQGGADLSNAQSGLFFDVDRNGEGIILEMLSATSALITMFTYDPNKSDLMWFIGVGNIVGNSVVIDNIQSTSGGVFGAGFDTNAIVNNDVGSLSVVFPDCNASENPGRMIFQTKSEFKDSIENLLVKSSRLSRLLNCDQSQPNPQSGRSGAFYDPARSGEGVFVEVLDNGSAVVIFYTYTPDGKQFWLISSDVQINGNTITANMIYPAATTGFGSQFNPSEVDFQPWGTLTLEYQSGCSLVNMSYASTVSGYGSGNHAYQRLTQPSGTTCDL